jgi:NAD(P)-dependent dehydrogenase (short-subunit alcohol dehydrogenase family)
MTQLLTSNTAIIYGAGGSIGSAVARTFAADGATVHLVGRTRAPLERLAAEIGDAAHVAVFDALDERAVDAHADAVAAAGGIDVSFNLITLGDAQGTPIADMTKDAFVHAIVNGASALFLTARAAARHMRPQGSGVILHLSSGSARGTHPGMGNTGPKDAAMDATARYLAAELGPHGIRVCGIHTAAVQGTLTPREGGEGQPRGRRAARGDDGRADADDDAPPPPRAPGDRRHRGVPGLRSRRRADVADGQCVVWLDRRLGRG